tara:strand:- start:599 stop:883 length:285 start_codon:yes stop_codon:yes gene_type:complete
MWHVPVEDEDIQELPPVASKLFLSFYNVAGGGIVHPNDLKRFNEFIRFCHAKRVKLTEQQLEALLLRVGCNSGRAKKLSDIYYYGRELLKCRCP